MFLFSEFLLNILFFFNQHCTYSIFNHISYCCLQNVMNVENSEVGRFTKSETEKKKKKHKEKRIKVRRDTIQRHTEREPERVEKYRHTLTKDAFFSKQSIMQDKSKAVQRPHMDICQHLNCRKYYTFMLIHVRYSSPCCCRTNDCSEYYMKQEANAPAHCHCHQTLLLS